MRVIMQNNDSNRSDTSKIKRSKVGLRTVLTPEGSITSKDSTALEGMFEEFIAGKETEIIVDMKTVSFIDSVSLELLSKLNEDLKQKGGRLKFINLNAICKDIFIATRLINSMRIYGDIHDAIRS